MLCKLNYGRVVGRPGYPDCYNIINRILSCYFSPNMDRQHTKLVISCSSDPSTASSSTVHSGRSNIVSCFNSHRCYTPGCSIAAPTEQEVFVYCLRRSL